MTLTWYGHACFLIESAQGSVIFDPYSPASVPGLRLPALMADAVICSHGHRDHNFAAGVRLTGNTGAYKLTQVSCWHDAEGGMRRGENLISIIEAEGLRLAHMGDIGHMPTDAQLSKIGRVDVLLIPVGGYYTIDARTAHEIVRVLSPRVTVPMHYRGAGFGYDEIVPVDDFLALSDNVRRFYTNVLTLPLDDAPITAALKCPVCAEEI